MILNNQPPDQAQAPAKLVIVTGMSGAGKSQAIRALEDMGYFCVDNLPPALMPKFGELLVQSEGKVNKAALVMDIRGGQFFESLAQELDRLTEQGIDYEILFLEASDETLIRRFKESRRRHPLTDSGRIWESIQQERRMLCELRGQADKIIDTTDLPAQQLKDQIVDLFGKTVRSEQLSITLMSFGYKYGTPRDADLLMDVRFLPNPHYISELQPLTGNDQAVVDYVMGFEVTEAFNNHFHRLIEFLLPHYVKEGKAHLVIGVGCTGGKHRSVALTNYLGKKLKEANYRVAVKHRDISKDRPSLPDNPDVGPRED